MQVNTEKKSPMGIWPTIPWKVKDDGSVLSFLKTLFTVPSAWGMHALFTFELVMLILSRFSSFHLWSEPTSVNTSLMNIITFVMTYILILAFACFLYVKSQETKYKCSAATIFRWFFFSMFCMEFFSIGMYLSNKVIGHYGLLFGLPALISSAFFAYLPGSTYERTMRFFGFNPASINGAEPYQLNWWQQIIWGFRVVNFALFFGVTNGLLQKKHFTTIDIKEETMVNKCIIAFIGAGFHEETFKILLLGTMTLIPKWKGNPTAILVPAILASVGFAYLEMPQYLIKIDMMAEKTGEQASRIWSGIFRGLCILLHALFTFPVAIAITRQRGQFELKWIFELLGAFAFAIFTHALYDLPLFIGGWVAMIPVLFLIFGVIPLGIFLITYYFPRKRLQHQKLQECGV